MPGSRLWAEEIEADAPTLPGSAVYPAGYAARLNPVASAIQGALDTDHAIDLKVRGLAKPKEVNGAWRRTVTPQRWNPNETAVVICDMWDYHHSYNATKRVGEIAPRMNRLVAKMRERGVLIVHAPSSCMGFYKDHPARKRAQAAPRASNQPKDIGQWCNSIPGEEMKLYPIDQSDGGDDDDPKIHTTWAAHLKSIGRNPKVPWKRQIETIAIDSERDIISDQGREIWNVMEQRGIKNVMLVGVHTNMCVLGRPFGLRQMSKNGRNTVLVRDMTDTMYNPARRPFVSHYRGTDLIVEHIEKYIAPTITSDQIIGGKPFTFKWDVPTKVVVAIAEPEYGTWNTLPALAKKIWTKQRGYEITVLIGDAKKHNIPGLVAALKDADVLLLSVRRQALPKDQLQAIRDHLAAGKPLLGIRTSSHAFALRGNAPKDINGRAQWPEFDAQVLGGNYHGHYGNNKPYVINVAKGAEKHPILAGVKMPHTTLGGVYQNIPLAKTATPLLVSTVEAGKAPEPIAWTHTFGKSKVFYTSLGHPSDFKSPAFEKLLWNAMEWMRVLPSDIPDEAVETSEPSAGVSDKHQAYRKDWVSLRVPGRWDDRSADRALADYDGFAWYRAWVGIPKHWAGKDVALALEKIDNSFEVYLNGERVGGVGDLPPKYRDDSSEKTRIEVPAVKLASDKPNLIAIRVYDHDGNGGFEGAAPTLVRDDEKIVMDGDWQFRIGDDLAWAKPVDKPDPKYVFAMPSPKVIAPHGAKAATDVAKFHVFLLMGQSNMTSGGATLEDMPGVRFIPHGSKVWAPVKSGKLRGYRLGAQFAKNYMKRHPGVSVGLIMLGRGGTRISGLHKGTAVYAEALEKAKIARESGVLKGVLWHQGESDTTMPHLAKLYDRRLRDLVEDLRMDLDDDTLPFVVGNLGEFYGTGKYHLKNQPSIALVRKALRDLPTVLPHTAFAESTGGNHRGDFVHFDDKAYDILGCNYADAYERAVRAGPRASWAKGAKSPRAALMALRPGEGLAIDSVLSEPMIEQPLFVNFDERGRMWVVEFRQYPHPAGLRIVSRDSVWRNVYDKVPPPPPHAEGSPFRGTDRISIHEDTNGDGHFDTSKTFLDGLSMATSVAHGRGGVWVMNPPYLLFYPDKNRDDVPDGDPVVHLKGFWLEDSHSIANSLRWGPDGWLYGVQGSTVSADIEVVGKDSGKPIHTQGQQVWRYHPEQRVFEVYSEGGGNAFGCEIDNKGRVFSGHNGGDTRGFHYAQGAYLRKRLDKHGGVSNPYAFGLLSQMPHNRTKRFTHNFIIYEGGALPERYRGKLIGVDPMNRNLPVALRTDEGATFRTKDVDHAITTDDNWFRPVDIKHGPDGSIYIADWYDAQVNHYRNHEGKIDKMNGRVYRVRPVDYKPVKPFDLSKRNTGALLELLNHPNRWYREQARRLIADRRDASIVNSLQQRTLTAGGQLALEYLWATHLSGGFSETFAAQALQHKDPYVRLWAVRLLGDRRRVSESLAIQLAQLAMDEKHVEVRSQLAASAKRLPADTALPIIAGLLRLDADTKDRYIPLQIWWALEAQCGDHADAVVTLFKDETLWNRSLVRSHIAGRLMRRFAATGLRRDLVTCAELLEVAPDMESKKRLMAGFELAYRGKASTSMPARLVRAISESGGASLAMRVRNGEQDAIEEAIKIVGDPKQPTDRRVTYASLFGEVVAPKSVPVLLATLGQGKPELQQASLTALQAYDESRIGQEVVKRYGGFDATTRDVARTLLAGRSTWAKHLVEAVKDGRIEASSFGAEYVAKLRLHDDSVLASGIDKIWGKLRAPTPEHFKKEIDRVSAVLAVGKGDPYAGKPLYLARCATCHKLFADGGAIGPDLTSYQRKDTANMLLNIINPNAEIREGYENFIVTMKDERVITGFKADEDKSVVVIRGADGQAITLKRNDIASMKAVGVSLMPPGMLTGLTDQQLRDFFAYFRTTQPLVGRR